MRWIGNIMLGLAGIAAALVAFYLARQFTAPGRADQQAAQVAATGQSQAAAQAEGHAAVQDAEAQTQAEAAAADLTRKNTDAIEHAQGAQTPVQPDVYRAALRALCLRDAYRNDPRCVQLRHPGS